MPQSDLPLGSPGSRTGHSGRFRVRKQEEEEVLDAENQSDALEDAQLCSQSRIWFLGCGSFLFSCESSRREREIVQLEKNLNEIRRRRGRRRRRRKAAMDSIVEDEDDHQSRLTAAAAAAGDDENNETFNFPDRQTKKQNDNNNKKLKLDYKKCKTRKRAADGCSLGGWRIVFCSLVFLFTANYLAPSSRLVDLEKQPRAHSNSSVWSVSCLETNSTAATSTTSNLSTIFRRSPTSIFDSFFSTTTTTTTTAGGADQLHPHESAPTHPKTSPSSSASQPHPSNAAPNSGQTSNSNNNYNDITHMSYRNGQTSDKVTLPGDILLGGLFPIHMKGTKVECGQINRDRGIQRLEAMLYALDRINEDSTLLPDIKLGAILLDSCSSSTYALNQSLEFIRASINTVESSAFECKDKSTPRPKYGSKMIAGVIGGSYSEVSLQVANLLRLFRIPQVSYASTGTALSDKTLYDLFARTVPSDMFQARAIADIVLRLNWSYVSLVSSEGLYGDSGSKEFIKQASNRRICIAIHEKISPTIGENAYDQIVLSLQKRNATGVVLFTRAEDSRELLLAVKRAKLLNNFAWVAADGWGTHQKLVEGVEEVAWGAITVELQAKAIPGFDSYMKALTPWGNARNPWFSEYWQEWFDCQLQANLLQQQRLASGYTNRRRSATATDGGTSQVNHSDKKAQQQQLDEQSTSFTVKQRRAADEQRQASSVVGNCSAPAQPQSSRTPESNSTSSASNNSERPNNVADQNERRCVYPLAEPSDSSSGQHSNGRQQRSSENENFSSQKQKKRTRRSNSFAYPSSHSDELELVKQFCSPNLRISESNGYRQEQKVQFVVDAVYAMAHALHKAWLHLCDGQPGVVCEALKELNGGEFYNKYLLNVSFKDLAGSEVKFDERGDGLGRYNIYNFRQVKSPNLLAAPNAGNNNKGPTNNNNENSATINSNDSLAADSLDSLEGGGPAADAMAVDKAEGVAESEGFGLFQQQSPRAKPTTSSSIDQEALGATAAADPSNSGSSLSSSEHIYTSNVEFEYSTIGRWTEDEYNLELDDIQFFQGEPNVPESYCSRPCELGQAKIMRAGDHCCWICKTCQPYEFLPDEYNCQDCGIGRWPVPNKTSCYDLPQKYLRWDSIFSLISLSIACLGIAFTIFVTVIFIKYLDTPVVKASGRELSFILLAGIACCHLSTFVLLSKPTSFICGTQRFLVNFGFALMYASLLVKTNRISRIFNCARKSAKRPSFISPKSQMLITGILVAIQIFLTIIWFVFEAPGIRADSPEGKRDEVILKCRAKGKSFIISLVYNMILITTCTIYAVKTRKIPENFNESKFIGFTMYTTIVIWLAFVTMFFGTNNSYEIQINTMCVCISLSAYVTLFCLFSPKISIILLHPDKNVRKLTMNSATYKRAFKPVSSVASAEGRNNLASGYGGGPTMGTTAGGGASGSGAQPDAASGGPVSTTSNVLNLAESQNRFQESSIISNVVNSNSAGSHCSQKTPIDSSQQQLALVGVCASCGAHQLASMPMNSSKNSDDRGVSNGILRTSTRFNEAGGTNNATFVNSCQPVSAIKSSSSMRQKFPSAAQQSLIATSNSINNVVGATTNLINQSLIASSGGGILPSNNLVNYDKATQQTTSTTAKVLHNKLSGATVVSSSIVANDKHQAHRHQHQAAPEQIHQAHVHRHDINNQYHQHEPMDTQGQRPTGDKKKQIASMSRLNELTSNMSSGEHHCIDDSISSLANDSFMNTSQENTPCNNGLMMLNHGHDHHHRPQHSSVDALQQNSGQCRGSDSMLCNQSVQSMDYCSDCCPSVCHCSCPACSSNGGEDNGMSLCSHTRSSAAGLGGVGADADDGDDGGRDGGTMCMMQLVHHQGECSMLPSSQAQHSTNLENNNQITSLRRRRSEEPTSCLSSSATESRAARIINQPTPNKDSQHWRSELVVADDQDAGTMKTRRSQTMEMRTMVAAADHHHHQHQQQQSKRQSKTVVPVESGRRSSKKRSSSSRQEQLPSSSTPVAYALQKAATSVFGAATSAQIPLATMSSSRAQDDAGVSLDKRRAQQQVASSGMLRDTTTNLQSTSSRNKDELSYRKNANSRDHNNNKSLQSKQLATAVQSGDASGGGTIQASLEMVKKSEEARRKELATSSAAALANRSRRKSSCFNYHDDYEYSYGLVHSNSDSERDYYYDDYDSATEAQLAASASLSRDDAESSLGATRAGTDYDAAYEYYDDEDDDGAVADDDDGGDEADLHDDDNFEHDGRVTLDRQTARPDSSSKSQRQHQVRRDRHRLGPKSNRRNNKASKESEELRINSVALITATLSTGGAIVDSGSSSAANQNIPKQQPPSQVMEANVFPSPSDQKQEQRGRQHNHETAVTTTKTESGDKISYLGTL